MENFSPSLFIPSPLSVPPACSPSAWGEGKGWQTREGRRGPRPGAHLSLHFCVLLLPHDLLRPIINENASSKGDAIKAADLLCARTEFRTREIKTAGSYATFFLSPPGPGCCHGKDDHYVQVAVQKRTTLLKCNDIAEMSSLTFQGQSCRDSLLNITHFEHCTANTQRQKTERF